MSGDDLEWGGIWGGVRGRLKKEVIHVYYWLIHIIVEQKPAQHHKVIIISN